MNETPQQPESGTRFENAPEVKIIQDKLTDQEFIIFISFVKDYLIKKKETGTNAEPELVTVFDSLKAVPVIQSLADQEYDNLLLGLTYLLQDL